MNYFSGAMTYIAGAPTAPAAVIPRLVSRAATSTLPRDRRSALADLAAAAADNPAAQAEAAETALKVVYAVLEQDREFDDTLRVVLDVLICLCGVMEWRPPADPALGPAEVEAERARWEAESRGAAEMATGVFLGLPGAMALVLELLDTRDLFIKCSAIEVLTAMAANARETAQGAVLASEEAVAKIADLLDDPNALVRTNATLLLSALAEGSEEICKIAAFSGVLETLFRTLVAAVGGAGKGSAGKGGGGVAPSSPAQLPRADMETLSDADPEVAIAVTDSLTLVRTLLHGSSVTQTFLRDAACIPKLAHVLNGAAERSAVFAPSLQADLSGPARAAVRHNYANLLLAVDCVGALVFGDSADATRNRSACAASGIFRIVMQLCFALPPGGDAGEAVVLRVAAMRCAAALVTCHEETRALFAAPMSALGGATRSRSPQIVCVEAMTADKSAAARAGAHALLSASLVADATLNLPMTSLLNAIVTDSDASAAGASRAMTGNTASPSTSIAGVASLLKATTVGWPNDADGAGVFYAANVIAWVAARVRGARERLLGSHVSGSGDALLSRAVRALGQAVRENAPAPVRIGLLRLVCTWLHGSPSAVSAFLSSAMHLPLILELVTKKASRGDTVAEAHVQGLAALLLAICLETADVDDGATVGGFVSGGGGPSAVIPRSTLVDIVRNRIGVSTFTARLDELRATRAFSAAATNELGEALPHRLAEREKSGGVVPRGSLGHELWYDAPFAALVNDVYSKVGARVMEFATLGKAPDVAGGSVVSSGGGNVGGQGGAGGGGVGGRGARRDAMSVMNTVTPSTMTVPLIESSSRDDVLVSYKELIRTQDSSLNEARVQVHELEAALREAQLELDAKNRAGADGALRSEREKLVADNAALSEKTSALEELLDEKSTEFAALSEAYTALEAMGGGGEDEDAVAERELSHQVEVERLRQDKASAMSQFYSECDKTTRLEQERSRLQLSEQMSLAQLRAIEAERDALRDGGDGSTSAGGDDIAEWRRRALSCEGQVAAVSDALKRAEETVEELRARTLSLEACTEESNTRAVAAAAAVEKMKAESVHTCAARKRELQMARESVVAAQQSAKEEMDALRSDIAEAKKESERANSVDLQGSDGAVFLQERDAALLRVEALSSEVIDLQNSMAEWKERCESASAQEVQLKLALTREQAETERLSAVAREAQSSLVLIKAEYDGFKAESGDKGGELDVANRRIAELEEQRADFEEMRVRSAEELAQLKEEVAARAEQTIRLSGNVYEAEESREEAEARAKAADARVLDLEQKLANGETNGVATVARDTGDTLHAERSSEDEEYIAAMTDEIVALKAKIGTMQEKLDDAADKQGLMSAISSDRDEALARLQDVEAELASATTSKASLEAENVQLNDRLLWLGEAELAKRTLTERVVELEAALAKAEAGAGLPPSPLASSTSPASSDSLVSSLRVELSEKDMRLTELETSLAAMADGGVSAGKNISELEKQVTEAEALLSVVSNEKAELSSRVTTLEDEIESLQQEKTALESRVQTLEMGASIALASAAEEKGSALLPAYDNSQSPHVKLPLLEIEHAKLQADMTGLSERLSLSEQSKVGLEETLAACQAKEKEAVSELSALQAAAVGAEEEINDLKSSLASLTESLENETATLKTRMEKARASAEKEIADLKATLSDAAKSESREEEAATLKASMEEARASAEKEIADLKAALSDAAKSFTASAKELAEREELLVELSNEKSALTSDLERWRDDALTTASAFAAEKAKLIEQLVSVEKNLHISKQSNASVPALDEASAAPNARGLDASVGATNSAATVALISEIEDKVELLELKHAAMRKTEEDGDMRISSLMKDLATAKEATPQIANDAQSRVAELNILPSDHVSSSAASALDSAAMTVHRLEDEVSRLKLELSELKESSSAQLTCSEDRLKVATMELEAAVTLGKNQEQEVMARQAKITSLTNEVDLLKAETSKLLQLRGEDANALATLTGKLSELQVGATKTLAAHESLVGTLEENLASAEASHTEALDEMRETISDLESSIAAAEAHFNEASIAASAEKDALSSRVTELELEVEAAAEATEAAERQLRDSKSAATAESAQLNSLIAAAEASKADLMASVAEKEKLLVAARENAMNKESLLENALSSKSKEIENLEAIVSDAQAASSTLQKSLASTKEDLAAAERSLLAAEELRISVESDLSESKKRVASLDGEIKGLKKDVVAGSAEVQKLESMVSERDESLAETLGHMKQSEKSLAATAESLSEERSKSGSLSENVAKLEEEVSRLRKARGRLEEEADTLRSEIDVVEGERGALEKDNADLRQWVTDLEQQAKGLQSVAEQFEDVERSLDGAVAAHQSAMESNAGLVSKVHGLEKALEKAYASARSAKLAKEAAEAGQELAQTQVKDVDARLQQIRSSHTEKLAANEEKMRSNIKRCAELEVELAAAERQIAENGTLSDRMFALETELTRAKDNARSILARAEASEAAAEVARQEVTALEKELEASTRSAGGAAYAELEAEHNDLLMCLAEQELEYQHLKEATAAATTTNRTVDSVSAR